MTDQKKDRKVRRLTFRGKEIEELATMKTETLCDLLTSRARRKIRRLGGISGKYLKLTEKIKKSKKNLQPGERPKIIKTHLRDCIITPDMVGGIVGVYNGKEYKEVEVKFDMIGCYFGEFSITYQPTLNKYDVAKKGGKKKKFHSKFNKNLQIYQIKTISFHIKNSHNQIIHANLCSK